VSTNADRQELLLSPAEDKVSNVRHDNDLAARLVPFWILWGAPIAIMLSLNVVRPSVEWATGILSACFAWMGVGCVINARRCHRRHCYYSSPVLLMGAALTLLVGFGFVDWGSAGLMYVTWGTFAIVLLTFLSERLFGKYTH